MELKHQIRQLDKRLKRLRRANLRATIARENAELHSLSVAEGAVRFSRNRLLPNPTQDNTHLSPSRYLHFIESRQSHSSDILPSSMQLLSDFTALVEQCIRKAHTNRAPGPDGLVAKLFSLTPDKSAATIVAVWSAAGRLRHVPEIFQATALVPLLKFGDPTVPSNYRPIALVSHLRKILSATVNKLIMKAYRFHPDQFGFRPRSGTESATSQAATANASGHNCLAVLDLKGAYDNVQRDALLSICYDWLPIPTAQMAQNLLLSSAICVKDQTTQDTAPIAIGVPQGDPVSPSLFNIFLDVLLEQCQSVPKSLSSTTIQAYADDVLLLARTPDGLRRTLRICEDWTHSSGMIWATAKCSTLMPPTSPDLSLCRTTLT